MDDSVREEIDSIVQDVSVTTKNERVKQDIAALVRNTVDDVETAASYARKESTKDAILGTFGALVSTAAVYTAVQVGSQLYTQTTSASDSIVNTPVEYVTGDVSDVVIAGVAGITTLGVAIYSLHESLQYYQLSDTIEHMD